jgi:hypothetical protein
MHAALEKNIDATATNHWRGRVAVLLERGFPARRR